MPELQRKAAVVTRKRRELPPYFYKWGNIPLGTFLRADSKIDALFAVIASELKITRHFTIASDLLLDSGGVSRCRYGEQKLTHEWLYRAAEYSGIPYKELCAVVDIEPEVYPHPNARKGK